MDECDHEILFPEFNGLVDKQTTEHIDSLIFTLIHSFDLIELILMLGNVFFFFHFDETQTHATQWSASLID